MSLDDGVRVVAALFLAACSSEKVVSVSGWWVILDDDSAYVGGWTLERVALRGGYYAELMASPQINGQAIAQDDVAIYAPAWPGGVGRVRHRQHQEGHGLDIDAEDGVVHEQVTPRIRAA